MNISGPLRRPLGKVVAGAGLALVLAGAGTVALHASAAAAPTINATSVLTVTDAGSTEGRAIGARFNALTAHTLTVTHGPAAFLEVNWNTDQALDPECDVQLAVHGPSEWRLYGWAGDPPAEQATANSWGLAQEAHHELRDVQATILLPARRTGTVIAVWRVPADADISAGTTRVYLVHLCGATDRSPTVAVVPVAQASAT